MVRLGVHDDVGVRVEAPDVADSPQLGAEQVRLGNGEEDQQGDCAGQLEGHDPEHEASFAPLTDEGLVGPIPLRVPVFNSSVHLGSSMRVCMGRDRKLAFLLGQALTSPFI